MSSVPLFERSKAITAEHLNRLVAAANRTAPAQGAPLGTVNAGRATVWGLPCVVTARSLTDVESDGSVALHNASYTVRMDGDAVLTVPWQKRICRVQPGLIGPSVAAADAQLFWPAAVIDTAEADREPWRAHGTVYITAFVESGGEPRWMVDLYGEMPYRAC